MLKRHSESLAWGARMLEIHISDEVAEALTAGLPVVALESNVVANGLTPDIRLETALSCEEHVRKAGAIPAGIAVLDGMIHIGLMKADYERMSEGFPKLSPQNLTGTLVNRTSGATTIASTLLLADRVGINVVASAGMGGVHRDYAQTLDMSGDLSQLQTSKATLVCAGVKSVLDVPKTLEFLETAGIPVIGYPHAEFPSFYSAKSGYQCPIYTADLTILARMIHTHRQLTPIGSVMVTHPIDQKDEIPASEIEEAIGIALERAQREHVTGPAVTNLLTAEVAKATEGRSARANRSVVETISRVGAELSVALTRTREEA